MNFKRIIIVFLVASNLNSCTTVYRIPKNISSIYLLKKGSKVDIFDYKDKDKFSVDKGVVLDLPTDHYVDVKIKKIEQGFIYTNSSGFIDTLLYSDKKLKLKKEIIPIILPRDVNTVCNGIEIYNAPRSFNYFMKYAYDSIVYFNNHPPIDTYVFEYYACYEDENISSFKQPLSLSVSKKDGMIFSIDYSRYTSNWFKAFDTLKYEVYGSDGIVDYRRVFCTKRRLRKFLM